MSDTSAVLPPGAAVRTAGEPAGAQQPGAGRPAGQHTNGRTTPAHRSATGSRLGNRLPERRWLVLAVLGVAQLMVVLDATIVNIALPQAQAELGFSTADRQWVVTAYSLAFGGLLLLGGRLSDIVGRRNTLVIGLVGFAAASALGGASPTFEWLVAARALQGLFGALLAPSALALLTVTFSDPKERGRAFGIFGSIAGAGAAVGLLLGGALTEYVDWSWCLYVNVPIAVVALVGALVLIERSRPAEHAPLDIPGVLTSVVGLVALVYGFSRAEVDGWTAPLTLGLIAGGVVLLLAFVAVQKRVSHPLLPLRIVADRRRGGALLAISLAAIGMFAVFLFLTYFLQQTLGFSPLTSGVAFLPMVVGIVTSSTVIVPRVLPRSGPRWLVATGGLLGAVALAWLSRLQVDSGYAAHVLPALVVMGLGMGLIFGSAFNTATAGVAGSDAGVASASVNTGQQVGGALGTALLNTIAAQVAAHQLSGGGRPTPQALEAATVAGDSWAFLTSAAIFVLVALCGALIIPGGIAKQAAAPDGAPQPAAG